MGGHRKYWPRINDLIRQRHRGLHRHSGGNSAAGRGAVQAGHGSPQNALQNARAHRSETGLPGDDQVRLFLYTHVLYSTVGWSDFWRKKWDTCHFAPNCFRTQAKEFHLLYSFLTCCLKVSKYKYSLYRSLWFFVNENFATCEAKHAKYMELLKKYRMGSNVSNFENHRWC